MHWQSIALTYAIYLAIVSFLRPEFRRARQALLSPPRWPSCRLDACLRAANTAFMVIVPAPVPVGY